MDTQNKATLVFNFASSDFSNQNFDFTGTNIFLSSMTLKAAVWDGTGYE